MKHKISESEINIIIEMYDSGNDLDNSLARDILINSVDDKNKLKIIQHLFRDLKNLYFVLEKGEIITKIIRE